MSGHAAGLIEVVLVFGVVLAWAFWELWALRRDKRRDAEAASARSAAERPGHPERQHGADDGGSQTPQ